MPTFATLTAIHTWEHQLVAARSVSEQVQQHLNAKSSYVLKFTPFLAKNSDAALKCKEICVEQYPFKVQLFTVVRHDSQETLE